ncbi:MATE efflux family protein 5-like, partial [Trifolium medium]|nr:MATE efflux family protein 5-like [Trifolium medium]
MIVEEKNEENTSLPIIVEDPVIVEEVKKQLWISFPLISVALLTFGIDLISVMIVGHL